MLKFLLMAICFKVAKSSLTLPEQNDAHIKNCLQHVIETIVSSDTSILFVYYKDAFDTMPNVIKNPYVNIEISKRKFFNKTKYIFYKDLVVFNFWEVDFFNSDFYNVLWNMETLAHRKFLIVLRVITKRVIEALRVLWVFQIIDVVVLGYNLETGRIILYTADLRHPAHECGDFPDADYIKQGRCSTAKSIPKSPKVLEKYHNCKITYYYKYKSDLNKFTNELTYLTWFILENIEKNLNITIESKMYIKYCSNDFISLHIDLLKRCRNEYHSCSSPFLIQDYVWLVPPPKITAFLSNLMRVLTVPQYRYSLKTVEELASSEKSIIVSEEVYDLFDYEYEEDENEENIYYKIKEKLLPYADYEYKKLMKNKGTFKNYTALTTTIDADSLVAEYNLKTHNIIDSSITGPGMYSLFVSSRPYVKISAHKIVTILIESGLIDYQRKLYKNMNNRNANFTKKENIIVTMNHLYPVFIIWGIGMVLATVVFFLERLVRRK
ncbi:hypothetical protein FQA39_LY04847 [Lamprigera yunnana]|nr:hypothetical protein FQA39_LY04847 [Lamprigera yunnana]